MVLVGTADPRSGHAATPARPPPPRTACLRTRTPTPRAASRSAATGKLWISVPDGASPRAPDQGKDPLALRAQNPNSLAGKLLRVDPATGNGVLGEPELQYGRRRTVRSRAPGSRASATRSASPSAPAARGLLHHRRGLGSLGGGSTSSRRTPAPPAMNKNYGWPCREGPSRRSYTTEDSEPYQSGCPDTLSGNVNPLVAYDSSGVDHAIIGSAFYTGGAWPAPWTPPGGRRGVLLLGLPERRDHAAPDERERRRDRPRRVRLRLLGPGRHLGGPGRLRRTSWRDRALRREHRGRRRPVRDRWQGVAHHGPMR